MKNLIVIGLLLLSGAANSALVTYIVEGDLTRVSINDPYVLDGAHYLHKIVVDTSAQFSEYVVTTDGNDRTSYYNDSNAWVSSNVTLTNRPNGAADTTVVTSQAYSTDFGIQNILEDYPHPNSADAIHVGNAALSGEFQGLITGGLFYFFPKSYFPGSGPHALPDMIDPNDMFVAERNVSWSSNVNTGGPSSQYVVSNGIIYTSPVPLPPALWLFGSGLLGLAGVTKKKAA